MKWHPSLGYSDEGFDLAAPEFFGPARQEFGQARVLHPVAYRSKAFADLEDEKIWTRAWVCVGMQERIPGYGDLLPYTVGNHGVHVQRDDKGQLQGRFNKAQHGGCRTIPLQCQTGKKTKCSFTSCGYSRDRDVMSAAELNDSAPAMGQYLGFNPAKLVPIRVETWGPFVFVNLDTEARPLAEQFDGLTDKIGCRLQRYRRLGRRDVEPASNWKIVGRNFLNGSRRPSIENLAGPVGSRPEQPAENAANSYWLYEADIPDALAIIMNGVAAFGGEGAADRRATFCWAYPNLLLALLPNHIVSWIVQPTDQTACLLHMDVMVRESAKDLTTGGEQKIFSYWLERTRRDALAAEGMLTNLLSYAAPEADLASQAMPAEMPIEDNYLAYRAQKYLIDQLLAQHTYYWNDAYTNPKLAVSPSTRGAS
jgi:phenylpropionate dioxygenase-like ring-hydroxylating dioxygenase large terminal subunit